MFQSSITGEPSIIIGLLKTSQDFLRIKKEISDFTLILSERHRKPHILSSLEKIGIKDILFLEDKSRVIVPELYTCDFPGTPDFHRNEMIKEVNIFIKLIQNPLEKSMFQDKKLQKERSSTIKKSKNF